MTRKRAEKVSYGIVGVGPSGYVVADRLSQSDAELLVIDKDEEKIQEIREITENAYVVKSLDKKTLMETGIQNCDVAVVCIGEHMDYSVLTTLNLVSMGIPKVIAKATSAEHGIILEKLGAEVVYPERDMATRLANRLENAGVLDFMQLSEQINISKLMVPAKIVGRTISDIDIRSRLGLNIIAIENGDQVIENVNPDYQFREKDILIVSGSRAGMQKLTEWIEER